MQQCVVQSACTADCCNTTWEKRCTETSTSLELRKLIKGSCRKQPSFWIACVYDLYLAEISTGVDSVSHQRLFRCLQWKFPTLWILGFWTRDDTRDEWRDRLRSQLSRSEIFFVPNEILRVSSSLDQQDSEAWEGQM